MATTTDWQCNKCLTECIGHMLKSELACDITFLLGEEREVVRAHKFILISRSPVFYAMFEGPLSEKGDVLVPDICKDIFQEFLRYLYTDNISLSYHNAIHVLYAAKKYCVDRLTTECWNFFQNQLTTENACCFLEQSHVYSDDKLAADCHSFISSNAKKCLQSTTFADLCRDCVYTITKEDDLIVAEEVVYKAVIRWSEAECGRQNLEVTDAHQRLVLGDILYNVRFPVMDYQYFTREVLDTDVLTPDEFLVLQRLHTNHKLKSTTQFKTSKRKVCLNFMRIERFLSLTCGWNHAGRSDAISFKVSKTVNFGGIGMYGCENDSEKFDVTIELLDAVETLVSSSKQTIITDQTRHIYDVMLDVPYELQADTVYTVVATMTGQDTKFGIKGSTSKHLDEFTVSFMSSSRSNNGTDIHHGQIPCLLLSLL